jgi:pimeloyl-ACP methyl ester carboxylesterase
MGRASTAAVGSAALLFLAAPAARSATLEPSTHVHGVDVVAASVRAARGAWRAAPWDDLDRTALDPGRYEVRFVTDGDREGGSLEVPYCAGRQRVTVDGHESSAQRGPLVVTLPPGPHEVVIEVVVSNYERRIACGGRPRFGVAAATLDGLEVLSFSSPWVKKGGGRALVYVPPRHDPHAPGPLLVGLHPWNGSMWTYAAYAQLLREARDRDVLLLMPSGLGNSLYTADAEDEVMRAIAAVSEVLAIDGRAVSLWGASMGGAGATTIGFHHPDRFASVTSFFGDSKYDLTTYARSVLPSDAAAHLVNALDVVESARNLPVWLIHGEDDRTSPIRQSALLAAVMRDRGFHVRFDAVPAIGHSGALVARFLPELVALAASARTPEHAAHVTYRSVRASDTEAYGLRMVRARPSGDAFVDVERRDDAVHVLRAEGVRTVALSRGALGTPTESPPPIVVDDADAKARGLDARWER